MPGGCANYYTVVLLFLPSERMEEGDCFAASSSILPSSPAPGKREGRVHLLYTPGPALKASIHLVLKKV